MRTGGKMSDLADNTSPDVKPVDIVSKRISQSAQNLIGRVLKGRGRKRKQLNNVKKNKPNTQYKEEEDYPG
jgi:hypothetical protein